MTSKSIDHKSTNTRIIWKLDILWKLPIWDKDIKWKTDVGNMETIDLLDVCLPQTSVYKKKKKKKQYLWSIIKWSAIKWAIPEYHTTFFWLAKVLLRNLLKNALYVMSHFSLDDFKVLFFSFKILIIIYLSVNFFGFLLFRVYWDSNFVCFLNWKFWAIVSLNNLIPFLSSSSVTSLIYINPLDGVP